MDMFVFIAECQFSKTNTTSFKKQTIQLSIMGVYKYLKKAWQKKKLPAQEARDRLANFRTEEVTKRLEHPTRLDRARSLGYRAKPGIFIVRQRVTRGPHQRPNFTGGRRPRNMSPRMNLRKDYRLIAEERAVKKYVNCEVVNSYYVGKDGKNFWFEIILADKAHPSVLADKRTSWLAFPANRRRVFRGLTSAGKGIRGLHKKGKGTEKARPSRRANLRRL